MKNAAIIVLLLIVITPVYAQEEFFTIQLTSTVNHDLAEKVYESAQHNISKEAQGHLRIELVGKHYCVRLGKFTNGKEALALKTSVKGRFPNSIIMSAYYKRERIISETTEGEKVGGTLEKSPASHKEAEKAVIKKAAAVSPAKKTSEPSAYEKTPASPEKPVKKTSESRRIERPVAISEKTTKETTPKDEAKELSAKTKAQKRVKEMASRMDSTPSKDTQPLHKPGKRSWVAIPTQPPPTLDEFKDFQASSKNTPENIFRKVIKVLRRWLLDNRPAITIFSAGILSIIIFKIVKKTAFLSIETKPGVKNHPQGIRKSQAFSGANNIRPETPNKGCELRKLYQGILAGYEGGSGQIKTHKLDNGILNIYDANNPVIDQKLVVPAVFYKNIRIHDGFSLPGEVYVMGNAGLGINNTVSTLLADGTITAGSGLKVANIMDSLDNINIGEGADLGQSITTEDEMSIGRGSRFRFLGARPVRTYNYTKGIAKELNPERLDLWPAVELSSNIRQFESQTIFAKEDFEVPKGVKVLKNLITSSGITIKSYTYVKGYIKVHKDVVINEGCIIKGDVSTFGNLITGQNVTIHGNIYVKGRIFLSRGCRIGTLPAPVTIFAALEVELSENVEIFGSIQTKTGGVIV